jgi:hypothetical protein
MQHTQGIAEKCTNFYSENLMGRNHLKDRGLDGRIIYKWIQQMYSKRVGWN